MLIFAGDLIDAELIPSPYAEDQGFATAVARFQSSAGALEAQQKLHGKPNTTKRATMIVEMHSSAMAGSFERRNTIDGLGSRTQTSSASSTGSVNGPSTRSRFGSTFQSGEKLSPPLPTTNSGGSGEFPVPEASAHFQNLFSPQSPLTNGYDDRQRMSGKLMINNDLADDETGELLKDPVAYAKSGQQPLTRRTTNPHMPTSLFNNLTLGGNDSGVSPNEMVSSRSVSSMHSPSTGMPSSVASPMGQPNGFPPNFTRLQYPPVNPADQNPPCNTLYVGNLPIDTSEDELKAVFSKQRGYKRLCFRTKQNGPMCFVEFEDVSFATKALHELYGHPLHNSVKGGIRLSFSKNPLGVRSGQSMNGLGPHAAMNPQAMASGYGNALAGTTNFSSVSGPPPGLAAPPGTVSAAPYRLPAPLPPTSMDGMFANPFGMAPLLGPDFGHQISPRAMSGGVPPVTSGSYGRETRGGYQDYMFGR